MSILFRCYGFDLIKCSARFTFGNDEYNDQKCTYQDLQQQQTKLSIYHSHSYYPTVGTLPCNLYIYKAPNIQLFALVLPLVPPRLFKIKPFFAAVVLFCHESLPATRLRHAVSKNAA